MTKTMADWDDNERNDMDQNDVNQPLPGESAEDYFQRRGYAPTEPTSPAEGHIDKMPPGSYRSEEHQNQVAEFMALQDQMVMEASGFGKEVVAYSKSLLAGGLPFQAVIVLTREWQQAEINRRTQLDALERRLDHE